MSATLTGLDNPNIEALILADSELPIRMEWVQGLGSWEAMPSPRLQVALMRIATSAKPIEQADFGRCGCFPVTDVSIKFPDGSIKRPDLAIYCDPVPEIDTSLTVIPEAVVEILSMGFEKKDLEIGVPLYLSFGVKDVVVVDPRSGLVRHFGAFGERQFQRPVVISLECGCEITV